MIDGEGGGGGGQWWAGYEVERRFDEPDGLSAAFSDAGVAAEPVDAGLDVVDAGPDDAVDAWLEDGLEDAVEDGLDDDPDDRPCSDSATLPAVVETDSATDAAPAVTFSAADLRSVA